LRPSDHHVKEDEKEPTHLDKEPADSVPVIVSLMRLSDLAAMGIFRVGFLIEKFILWP
jgi:hypothetical protein